MIEVVTAPSHLAGASVVHAREDTAFDPPITVLTLDSRYNGRDELIAVHAEDVRTVGMLPADLDAFRAAIHALPEPPEPADVERALALVEHVEVERQRPARKPPTLAEAREITSIEALRADVAHWKARAIAAENASEQKERLLNLLTDAAKREDRTIMAVSLTVGPERPIAMMLHTGNPATEEMIGRWAQTIAPWLRVIDAVAREADGKARRAAAEAAIVDEDDDE